MSLWNCAEHGLHGPMPGNVCPTCGKPLTWASIVTIQKSDKQPSPSAVPIAPQEAEPPRGAVEAAVTQARFSPCRSKRGAVVFSIAGPLVVAINGRGHNQKPEGFDCDGSADCKATCRVEAIHAEQKALLNAGRAAERADLRCCIRPYRPIVRSQRFGLASRLRR